MICKVKWKSQKKEHVISFMQMVQYNTGKHFRLSQSLALHTRWEIKTFSTGSPETLLKSGLQSLLLEELSDPVLQSFDNP